MSQIPTGPLTDRDVELLARVARQELRRPRHRQGAVAKREAPALRDALHRLEALGAAARHARSDDPRTVAGEGIVGAPHDDEAPGAAIVDTTKAVLVETVDVTAIETYRDGEVQGTALAMTLGGRINKSPDRARVTFLFGADGAASICGELMALSARIDPAAGELLLDRIRRLLDAGGFGRTRTVG